MSVPVLRAGLDFPDSRRSDHASFWDAGISAVMLTDTANFRTPHYHSQSDTIERLDFQFMRGVVDIALDALTLAQRLSVQKKYADQSSLQFSKSVYAVVGRLVPLPDPHLVRTNRCDSWCRESYQRPQLADVFAILPI